MNTTVEALRELYIGLGGSLTDTYEGIANGAPVSDYTVIPDIIAACAQIAEPGGGTGKREESWHQCPQAVRNYLANVDYTNVAYTESSIATYAPTTPVSSNTKPVGKTIDGVTYYNEVPGVKTPFASTNVAGTIEPLDAVRWLNTPHALNVRDLGGWACDGGTVKYGRLIRGGDPNASDIPVLVDQAGVMWELDLRGSTEAGRTESILGDGIGYSVFDRYQTYSLTDTDLWRQIIRVAFDCVLHSMPVFFHCAAGADRAATLACVLEGLLGVSQSDIDKDYELSCFYSGTGTDLQARRRNENDWKTLINQILAFSGSTFRDKCVSFVASLGITADEINEFRRLMIDGTPATVTPTVSAYTVTNTLTHVTNGNTATTATQYQPYEAELTPDTGYKLASVAVSMGGVSIKDSVYSEQIFPANKGIIKIPAVTGNIVVTAEAEKATRENLLTMNDGLINMRIPTDGTPTSGSADGYFITDYFPFDYSQTHGLRIKEGNTHLSSISSSGAYGQCKFALYDANKDLLCQWCIAHNGTNNTLSLFSVDGNDLVKSDIAQGHGTCITGGTIPSDWSTVKFIRLGLALNNAAAAISNVDAVMNSGLEIYAE